MKKETEASLKKIIRSVSTLIPGASPLVQWWAEMEADLQSKEIDELQSQVYNLQNPILSSHLKAKDVLELFFNKIESTNKTYWEIDDEFKKYFEVLNLWEKQGYLKGQHALMNRWKELSIIDPFFIIVIFNAVKGEQLTLKLRRDVWEFVINECKKGKYNIDGKLISKSLGVSIAYIDALLKIFELEGKGSKSKIITVIIFVPKRELC